MCKQWVVAGTFFHCDECQTFDACEACVAKGRQEVLPSGRAAVIVEEGQSEPYVTELAATSLTQRAKGLFIAQGLFHDGA